jgi:hypothetical protein
MALLKSVDNVPGVDILDYRDILYFNKYDYRIRMEIPGARHVYWCKKPEDLDTKINNPSSSYVKIRKDEIDKVKENLSGLKTLIEVSNERKNSKNYTVRVEGNVVAIFANDLQLLDSITNRIGSGYKLDCSQAVTSGFSGTKYFVNEPKHKYRVYLKSKRVEDTLPNELKETFRVQKKLYPSFALKRWLYQTNKNYGAWYFRWTSAAHFIDYDDESTLSYLAIMHGNILGRKYKLEKRPDNI